MNDRDGAGALALGLIGAAHGVEAQLETALEPLGLSLAKLGVLSQLVDARAPLPLCTLAARLCCVRSNVTQLVDRLEAESLVVRIHDPADRRSILAQITEKGLALQAAGSRALKSAERAAFARLGPRQRKALEGLVAALAARSA